MRRRLFGSASSSARKSGDIARDSGDWTGAVAHYRMHLEGRPDDHAIAIQLGHALKETGQAQDALRVYLEVLKNDPDNSDLLLSIGHAHKILGDLTTATAFYQRSSDLDGNRHALVEMGHAPAAHAAPMPITRAAKANHRKVLALLAPNCAGLVAVNLCDVVVHKRGDALKLTSGDPWIILELDQQAVGVGGLGTVVIDVSAFDDDTMLNGQLYIDYGFGFEELTSLHYKSSEPVTLLLAYPEKIQRLRWDPDRKSRGVHVPRLTFRRVEDFAPIETLIRDWASDEIAAEMIEVARSAFNGTPATARQAADTTMMLTLSDLDPGVNYRRWLFKNERTTPQDYRVIAEMTDAMAHRPSFSFVMPTYNTPPALLRACLDCMLAQTYPDFEICIADDNSPDPRVVEILREYAARDARIRFVRSPKNGHISAASNRALALASGDFIVLIDHDDVIPDFALFVVAHYINLHPDADVLFSDEDKIDLHDHRSQPYFKGNFSKFLMYGHNMVSHLGVYRRALVNQIGGFRLGLEGSQDYDLLLRCYEQSSDDRIVHIPHILYHWRTTPGSTSISADQKGYAIVAAQLAINGHFERTGMPLRSRDGFAAGCTGVTPSRMFETPLSIIIPTRNGLDLLRPCVDSILAAIPEHVEILIVDNGSDDAATLAYLADLADRGVARVLRYDEPFNFSRINNFAAEQATGEILCFLNNDTEVLASDWLNRARALLSLDEVGIVGARLLYPDGLLQHFGIALGMGGHGVAGTPHGMASASDPGYFGKARLMQEFSAVTAACMFIRKRDFAKVGGFEPELRVAYNDIDLCLKIRALGLKIVGDPEILLVHKESRTRGSDKKGERALRLDEEAAWMRERWSDELANDPYYSPNVTLDRPDFSPAPVPRVPLPWKLSDVVSPACD